MYQANFKDLPVLATYKDALGWESQVKPIRGRTPECKPIGKRRNTWVNIRKENDTVICKLYNTDVITYHEDGRIVVNLGGWSSPTTMAFIEELLYVRTRIAHNRVWIFAGSNDNSASPKWHALRVNEPNLLTRGTPKHGETRFIFHNPTSVPVHKINRSGANNVRKLYKPYRDYLVTTMRLRDNGFSIQEIEDMFPEEAAQVRQIHGADALQLGYLRLPRLLVEKNHTLDAKALDTFITDVRSTDKTAWYKQTLMLAYANAHMWYLYQTGWVKPTQAQMLKRLDDLILYAHRDECFTEEVSNGEVVRDAYHRFFSNKPVRS